MSILIDDRIFQLQQNGGISQIWHKVMPHLESILSQMDSEAIPEDYFLSTYYALPHNGLRSVVMVYDFIAERYAPIGRYHQDAIQKRQAIQQAAAVIAISQWVANDVRRVCQKEAQVAYCGTEIQRAAPQAIEDFKTHYQIEKPYILVIGRRNLYKNIRALYQAWSLFPAHEQMMIVCIGGEAPDVAEQHFAATYPKSWLQLHLPDEQMAAAYSAASILVYPSLYEGFGLPVLEAMVCGVPVVCGARAAIPEFALHIPYYADVFRPVSIAQAMTQALQADYDRLAFGMQLAKRYTWQRMANQIVQVIKDIPNES